MPIIRAARPFTLNRYPQVSWRFGVGVYDVPDPEYSEIISTPALRWHLDVEVLARGESLLQHRDPQQMWFAGNRLFRSLSVVATIEPRPIQIWKWPPWHPDAFTFPLRAGALVAAPGEQVTVTAPMVDAATKTGTWERQRRTATYVALPWGDFYAGAGTPVAFAEPHTFGYVSPEVGDVVVMGVPQTVPLRFRHPASPAPADRSPGQLARAAGGGDGQGADRHAARGGDEGGSPHTPPTARGSRHHAGDPRTQAPVADGLGVSRLCGGGGAIGRDVG
jgi:hypothetical protein